MSHFVEHTKEVTTWVGENPEEASRLLKRSPPKRYATQLELYR